MMCLLGGRDDSEHERKHTNDDYVVVFDDGDECDYSAGVDYSKLLTRASAFQMFI